MTSFAKLSAAVGSSPVDVAVLFVGVAADARREADLVRQTGVLRHTVRQIVDCRVRYVDDLLNQGYVVHGQNL